MCAHLQLPLELFDSPESELVDPAERIQAAIDAGQGGAPALSRFYEPHGSFTWAPCCVQQYDRCAAGRPSCQPGGSLLISSGTGRGRQREAGSGRVTATGGRTGRLLHEGPASH
jgi:hypothetical protein